MRNANLCSVLLVLLAACGPSAQPEAKRGDASPPSIETPPPVAATPSESAPTEKAVSEQPPNQAADSQLQLDKLVLTIPEGWQRKAPASSFVIAEVALPKAEGDEADGRLTVSVAGGSIDANVSRWRDQFGGKPEPAKEETKEVDGLQVTVVDFGGEFNDQRGPLAPATKRANYRMLAAIIPVDGELHFVKAVGPQPTMAAHAERFHKFIESAKKK